MLYNHYRPHQALDLAKPGERYHASRRSFPETLPPIEHDRDDLVRIADCNGRVSFKNRRLRLGRPFRRQPIVLRHTAEDGVFSVHFCTHRIGTIDLRTTPAYGWVDIRKAMPANPQTQRQPIDTQP